MNGLLSLIENQNKGPSSEQWDEPIGFDETNLPTFDSSVFPDWLRDYVEGVAESTQTPVDASSMACISALSTILARKFEVNIIGSWVETLNTYTVMALGSANRKSSVFKSFIDPITEHELEQSNVLKNDIAKQRAEIKAKEKRVSELERQYSKEKDPEKAEKILLEGISVSQEVENEEIIREPRFITADATPEKLADLMHDHNERIAILSAEGAEAFEMMAGRYSDKANVDIYLKGHSADYVSVDRMGRDSITLHNPTMTVGLFVQPSVIRDIPNNFQERGLTQRFLYSSPNSTVGYREVEPKQMKEETKDVFSSNMSKLLEMDTDEPITLTLSEEARRLEVYYRTEIEEMLKDEDISDGFQGWIGKLAGQIIRIAGILHIAQHVSSNAEDIPTSIGTDSLMSANKLRGYFIQHAKEAHGTMGVDQNDEEAKYVLRKIKEINTETIVIRDLLRRARKVPSVEDLKNILCKLEEMGYLIFGIDGRKNIVKINPKILTSEKA